MKRSSILIILCGVLLVGLASAVAIWLVGGFRRAVSSKPQAALAGERSIAFENVEFQYDSALFDAEGEIVPAAPLEGLDSKPDYVAPEHVRFRLSGPYAESSESCDFNPEICVFPVEGYREAFSLSPDYVRRFDEDLRKLKKLIADGPASWKGEVPYLPFIDAHQAFQAQVKAVDFQNGKGIFFLTDYTQEPVIITNTDLTYIYAGLTADGRYYVLGTFPVASNYLSDSYGAGSHDGYSLESDFYQDEKTNRKAYDAYISRVAKTLQRTPPDQFEPSLLSLEKVIRSLQVR